MNRGRSVILPDVHYSLARRFVNVTMSLDLTLDHRPAVGEVFEPGVDGFLDAIIR